jgi:hypothetical protein
LRPLDTCHRTRPPLGHDMPRYHRTHLCTAISRPSVMAVTSAADDRQHRAGRRGHHQCGSRCDAQPARRLRAIDQRGYRQHILTANTRRYAAALTSIRAQSVRCQLSDGRLAGLSLTSSGVCTTLPHVLWLSPNLREDSVIRNDVTLVLPTAVWPTAPMPVR